VALAGSQLELQHVQRIKLTVVVASPMKYAVQLVQPALIAMMECVARRTLTALLKSLLLLHALILRCTCVPTTNRIFLVMSRTIRDIGVARLALSVSSARKPDLFAVPQSAATSPGRPCSVARPQLRRAPQPLHPPWAPPVVLAKLRAQDL